VNVRDDAEIALLGWRAYHEKVRRKRQLLHWEHEADEARATDMFNDQPVPTGSKGKEKAVEAGNFKTSFKSRRSLELENEMMRGSEDSYRRVLLEKEL